MEQHLFRYQLVRHIADLRRMEPQNVGVIVQGNQIIRCRFNPYFGRKSGFDSENYSAWKSYFKTEIEGETVPRFQPDRLSKEFLEYLQNSGRGNYSVTRPLEIVMSTSDVEAVLLYLYETLVRRTEDKEEVISRPVSLFRHELARRGLENNRLLLKNQAFLLPNGKRELVQLRYFRNHGSDMSVLIQSVPWNGKQIQDTKGRLESALALIRAIEKAHAKVEVAIVMDNPPARTKGEDEGRALLREQFEAAKSEFKAAKSELGGVTVADNPETVVALSASIESDVRDAEETTNRRKQSGKLAL